MNGAVRSEDRRGVRRFGYGVAAMALCAGMLVAPSGHIATADTTGSDTASSQTRSERAESDPGQSHRRAGLRAGTQTETEPAPETGAADTDTDTDTDTDLIEPDLIEPELVEPEPTGSKRDSADITEPDSTEPDVTEPEPQQPVARRGVAASDAAAPEAAQQSVRRASTRLPALERTVLSTPVPLGTLTTETTRPIAPQPLSPLAELLTFPARLVNAVLQVLDLTATANRPDRPYGLQPINDLIFGAFREIERLLGLHRTPPPQPPVPTLTYTGPLTRPTPTVAQFLNASAAGYVLGSTPGGLVPFTVNGFQMASTNIFSGMVAKTWVTPEGQVIISYQGTTGGSHLLFNPLITISQIIADLQVVFTRTTPVSFYQAVAFAEKVQAAAALQGYAADDIFVTGHSLGGWQAQFVAQQIGLAGIGFEAPGINTRVPGNGADSMFVNIGTYGSSAPYMATDLPGLQPFMPPYVPGGGTKPHYGPIVMIGDPAAMTPLYNASRLWGKGIIASTIFVVDYLVNFFQYHLPGVQAYHLDVKPDPGIVLFLGTARGPVHTGYGTLTIPQLMKRASDDGILFRP